MQPYGIVRAAGVVGLATLLSRILGYVRDMVIAYFFGTADAADAFFVAFRIPNLFRRLFAEGSLTVAFIPIFTGYLVRESKRDAYEFANTVFTLLSIILVIFSCLGIVFSPFIVKVMAWGFIDEVDKFGLTVLLTRIMFPYIFFISLVALCMGILNSLKHFAAPALAPVLLNLTMILSVIILMPYFSQPILALAIGVILGGFLQLTLQIPFLKKKEDIYEATQEIWLNKPDSEPPEKPAKKQHKGRFVLMVVALVCLGGGVLWQNNVIHPFWKSNSKAPANKEEVAVSIQNTSQKAPVLNGSGVGSATVPTVPDSRPQKIAAQKGAEGAPEKAFKQETPGPQVVTIMPDSLYSRAEPSKAEEKPVSDAIASVGEPSAPGPSESSLSIFEGALSPVQSESPPNRREEARHESDAASAESASVIKEAKDSGSSATSETWKQSPYSLRLGAFRTLERAKKAVGEYKQNGLSPYWTQVDLGDKGVWFRVYTGHFEDREKAQRFREERGLKGSLVKETRYTTLVGVYDNEDELERKSLSLRTLDYSPYAQKDQRGRHRLLVGAFMTEEGAEAQQRDLEVKGIQSKVIRR